MSKELVISATRHETRVAMIEDDQVVEIFHQRENEYSLAGSIHKGRVTRVLPGMQSAFVDIGLDRDAFLYVSDFFEDNDEYDKIVTGVEEKVLKLDRTGQPIVAAPEAAPAPAGPESAPAAPAVEMAPPAETAAAAVPMTPPAQHAGGYPDQRRDDRDQRGRRSRRRRGGKGRGLPDSKFYSPGQRTGGEAAAPPVPIPEALPQLDAELEPAPAVAAAEREDFLVLPGESLAKYTGADEAEDVEEPEEQEAQAEPEAVTVLEPVVDESPASVPVVQVAAAAEVEPEPEVAVAVETAGTEAAEAGEVAPGEAVLTADEAVLAMHEVVVAMDRAVLAADEAAVAMDEEVLAADEATVAMDEEVLADDEATVAMDEEVLAADEATAAADEEIAAADEEAVAADEAAVAVMEDEGPEPARIPTSLTAALREQGPRYQHRVSRRMRRKGRDNRDNRGPAPAGVAEATRPQGPPEARPAESRPEQRTVAGPRNAPEPRADKGPAPSISDLLKEGQEIIVQIAKEPLGQKGARITSHIALPGRFLVYMPTVDHIGVSRKIPSDDERLRLKRILQANRTGIPGGYIVRTAGEGRSEEELRADMMFLYNMWLDMRQKAERKPAPLLIHHDLNVVERILRDQLTSSFKCIWADNEEIYESVLRFVQRFQPGLVSRVKLYTRSTPIFDEFNITSELEKALRPKVWLKSGGYIVINQTEALVAIDVNTGKYVGKSNRLEDTIVKTNTDAIKEIVRQIRLRDLGGIIVVDFIDMDERKNRQKVMQALEEAMRADRAPNKILQFNDFGLVAITRKRVKQSLERTLCTPCSYCEGAGYVKSPQTLVGEILQEAHKIARAVEGNDVMLRVSPEVAKLLKSNQNTYLQELEEILGRTVIVKSDPLLHQEKFDLA
jgi:ribonuclease G